MVLPVPADAEAADDAPLLSPAEGASHPMPRWYTPKRLLALFCVMQYMVYMDRGVRAGPCGRARPCRASVARRAQKPRDPRGALTPRRRRSSPAPA